MSNIEFTKEAEVLTSGGTTIEIQRGSEGTRIELNIRHSPNNEPFCSEDLLSQICNVFKNPHRSSYRWETLELELKLARKLLDKITSTLVALEVNDGTNDPEFLKNFSRELNECSRIVLPILALSLDARRLEVESMLECMREDNESESEPRQVDLLPIGPAQPVLQRSADSSGTVVKPLQKPSNGQIGKSEKPRGGLSPTLTQRLEAFKQKNKFAGTNESHAGTHAVNIIAK
ncbi:MAG TPA: hypothetical protein VN873_15950 [Candidatus Angelobacter sp.]|nr:hypothetical protein [Candidatus Angelobacter sp.]